jgi:hypothetical protein
MAAWRPRETSWIRRAAQPEGWAGPGNDLHDPHDLGPSRHPDAGGHQVGHENTGMPSERPAG